MPRPTDGSTRRLEVCTHSPTLFAGVYSPKRSEDNYITFQMHIECVLQHGRHRRSSEPSWTTARPAIILSRRSRARPAPFPALRSRSKGRLCVRTPLPRGPTTPRQTTAGPSPRYRTTTDRETRATCRARGATPAVRRARSRPEPTETLRKTTLLYDLTGFFWGGGCWPSVEPVPRTQSKGAWESFTYRKFTADQNRFSKLKIKTDRVMGEV